jgi:plasmid maintenance system killer protein
MEIHWKSEKLKQRVQKYAKSNEITARRMISIKAAKSFYDLVPDSKGRAHFLKGNLSGRFSIDLEKKFNPQRLICEPRGNFQIKDGQYIKESIVEFEIIDIDDTHK